MNKAKEAILLPLPVPLLVPGWQKRSVVRPEGPEYYSPGRSEAETWVKIKKSVVRPERP